MDDNNENKTILFTIIAVAAFMWWMIALRFFILVYFIDLFRDFGAGLPAITKLTFKSISIWYVVILFVVVVSFLAAYSKTKIKYLGVLVPIVLGVFHLIGLYLPIFKLGSVI